VGPGGLVPGGGGHGGLGAGGLGAGMKMTKIALQTLQPNQHVMCMNRYLHFNAVSVRSMTRFKKLSVNRLPMKHEGCTSLNFISIPCVSSCIHAYRNA